MSVAKRKLKRNRDGEGEEKKAKVVVLEKDSDEYGNQAEGSNALVVDKTKKEKKTETVTKTTKNKQDMRKKKEEKISKSKRRKLASIVERKKKKETQEDLLAQLSQYRLDPVKLGTLQSTAHRQDKVKKDRTVDVKDDSIQVHPVKLKLHETIHNKERKQENYYSTDSGEDDEEEVAEVSEVKEEAEEEEEHSEEATTSAETGCPMEETVEEEEEAANKVPAQSSLSEVTPSSKDEANAKKSTKKDTVKEAEKKKEPPVNEVVAFKRIPVIVAREKSIQAQREKLPIFAEEQAIVEAVNENTGIVVCGETGSGKTTQIPQMLYEAGYTSEGMLIGVTEPRRVAAISMAKRVGEELGDRDIASYQIRYEGNRNEKTKILFMTDGVLMKEMATDIMLKKYSVIIIDEAHERSMYSDVLIGLLSRIAPARAKTARPLKLIIMSATLRLDDFIHKKLFPISPPFVFKADSRQFPVTVHFDRRTPDNFMNACFRKSCRIHETLPDGGILIFVPGQRDVQVLIQKLASRYPIRYEKMKDGEELIRGGKKWKKKRLEEAAKKTLEDFSATDRERIERQNAPSGSGGRMDEYEDGPDMWDGDGDEDEEEDEFSEMAAPPPDCAPLYCLPLYSLLSSEHQRRVFEPPPEGARLCVIATNVAETSLTIPGIKYVVDSGFEKRRRFDAVTGVSQFIVARISQASADQRAGRAGRTGPGHAYRLYSSAVFTDFAKFSRPEIMDKPVDQLVLHLKSMNIVKVVNFPFPSAPPEESLAVAEQRLIRLGALATTTRNGKTEARITSLGRTLTVFPLAPAYAKVLALANQHDLLPYAIQLIATLSVREPLVNVASLRGSNDEETKQLMTDILKLRRSWCGQGAARQLGDLIVLMRAVTAAEEKNLNTVECEKIGVRTKAMLEVRKLRMQLTNVVNTSFSSQADVVCEQQLGAPSAPTATLLRQMMVCALGDRIAKRVDRAVTEETIPRGAYRTQTLEEYVYIDPCSMMFSEEPDYVLYQEIVQISDKKCMQTVMCVEEEWLTKLAEPFCTFGEPEKDEIPRYDASRDIMCVSVPAFFGPLRWSLGKVDRPIKEDIMLYRHFARVFLAGEVMCSLAEWTPKLLAPPTTMIRTWAKLQPRCEQLLNALIEKDAHSRAALEAQWEENPDYLMEEYLMWLPEKLHPSVQLNWPPSKEQLVRKHT